IDEPSMFKYGGQSAAPIFREIVDRVMDNPDYPLARRALNPAETVAAMDAEAAPSASALAADAAPSASALSADAAGFELAEDKDSKAGSAKDPKAVKAGITIQSASSPARFSAKGRGMPDLNNSTLREALSRLKHLGLDVEYTGTGRIIRQEPPAGTPVKPGRKCLLTLGWMG
ncbi:MAG: PASTA domain-containing protein, partial [Fibrobacteria bacterium]